MVGVIGCCLELKARATTVVRDVRAVADWIQKGTSCTYLHIHYDDDDDDDPAPLAQ